MWVRGEESEAIIPFRGCCRSAAAAPLRLYFAAVPGFQRRALDASLARSDEPPAGPLAARAGALAALAAAADAPLLTLVDDLQWIDPESRRTLLFAARRLATERIAMVLAVR